MRVSFYLPRPFLPSEEKQIAWREGRAVSLEMEGKIATAQAWIFQTWIFLQRAGFHAGLVHDFPSDGIVITLAGSLPPRIRPPRGLFIADVVSDGLPHPAAHVHIVQNALHARRLPGAVFMPHWPQPGIIPRDPTREDAFERIAFFGDKKNLAPELRDAQWQKKLQNTTGVTLEIRGADRWHDYHDVDAALAIRDFRGLRQLHKPATKLYNAWLAGVPFIGGTDSACAAEGNEGRDHLTARRPEDVLAHLENLRRDKILRHSLVNEGKTRAADYSVEALTTRWRKLAGETIPAMAAKRAGRAQWFNFCGDAAMRVACAADRIFRS